VLGPSRRRENNIAGGVELAFQVRSISGEAARGRLVGAAARVRA